MSATPPSGRRLIVLIGLVVVAATWFTWLRPTALGGEVSYVIIDGSSMEPTYEDGDLVLVREENEYTHGDVIAFRAGGTFDDPTRIIHRIIGDAGGGAFVTQGDNRDRIDPWEPTPDDIIGRATLHVPMAGDVAGFLTQPETFAALGGTAALVGGQRRRRRRRPTFGPASQDTAMTDNDPPVTTGSMQSPATSRGLRLTQPRWAFIGLVASAIIAIPVLALAWSALRAPDSTDRMETTGQIDYAIGLDYRFTGKPSAVYPDGTVTATRNAAGALVASDPLYSRLLDQLDVTVAFRVTEQGADRMDSSYDVKVDVETPAGWSTTLEEVGAEEFGDTADETLSVDLSRVAAQVADVAELTGVGGDAYTITVTPTLDVAGGSDDVTIDEQLTTPMTFTVEGNLITADAVEASDSRELTRMVSERASYTVGPFEMRTQAARAVLSGLALVLVAGIAWFASVLFGGVGLGEPARIAARYRSQMIDVAAATAPPGPVVMVAAIDELARIAKVEQSVILHEDLGDGAHRYRVFLGSVTYEYETAPEHAGAATGPAVASDSDETG